MLRTKVQIEGLPGGTADVSLPANAGDMGLIVVWKIPCVSEQLSLYSTDAAARRPLICYLWVKKERFCIESGRV